jgi:hypothetical protein
LERSRKVSGGSDLLQMPWITNGQVTAGERRCLLGYLFKRAAAATLSLRLHS